MTGEAPLDAVEALLLDEAAALPDAVVVVDAPALAAHLSLQAPVSGWCDSAVEHERLPAAVQVPPLTAPPSAGAEPLVVYRLPKALAALDEVAALSAGQGGRLLVGGRVKDLRHSMTDVLKRHFGEVSASRGVGKARVLRGNDPLPPSHERWPKHRHHADLDLTLVAHGATFGGTRIDPGTRLLIAHLDEVGGDTVTDLGSGNGTLAALLARAGRRVSATDVSWAAVASTRATALDNGLHIDTFWANGLQALPDNSQDAIVTNPPFHQGVAKESGPTLAMFTDARRVLRPGGEFWCVFNSHLPWRLELERRVGPTRVIDQNPRFTLTVSRSRAQR